MATFSEQMRAVTDGVVLAKRERAAAVAGLQEQTAQLLSVSRSFLNHLSEEHHSSSEQLRAELAADQRRLAGQVKALRTANRQHLQQARHNLRLMLSSARRQRQQHMQQLLRGFQSNMQQMAHDFQTAAQIWRQPHQTSAKN